MKSWFIAVLLLFFASLGVAGTARDMAAEAKIEKELGQLNPSLVAPFRAARIAMDKGDYAESARLLVQVAAQAPTFDPATRRLGSSLASTGKRIEGIQWGEKAVALKRSAANLSSLAYILAFPHEGKASREELSRAQALLREARTLPDGNDVPTLFVSTQVALQLDSMDEARALSRQLERVAPTEMATHYFAAIVAAIDEHWTKADREIRAAGKLGLDAATVQRFLDSGVHSRAVAWLTIATIAWVTAAWLAGLGMLCGAGFLLSRSTLRQIERSDPNVAISAGEARLRKVYRAVLNVTGAYYYLSLPIVFVLVLAVTGGIIYAFLAAGWLPIKLTLILVIGAIATIWSMGRSLFLKVKSEDPGRPLTRTEAQGLWQLTEEVAAMLQTRPVDEIRITPGTDLCVYERGTWREKMENKATRVLVLGTALLNDFKQQDFRCVLAHEYGHFSNRDTAGGDVALRVRTDMVKFYIAMLQAGQATWLNVAFHFLRFYNFVFRRISHGATRLQEVLADRFAAQSFGAPAFERGLRHVIRRSIEFDKHANQEIEAAISAKRPIANLYAASSSASDLVNKEFEAAISRSTTADDTHPAPLDRFRLISRVVSAPRDSKDGNVWDLFADRVAVEQEMIASVEKNVTGHRN